MDATRDQQEIVQWLSCSQAYPNRPESIEHLETHISHVFLAGNRVYKLKKPVKYYFLDFSSLADRQRACREELRLNRRLAPDIYLRMMAVVRRADGGFEMRDAEEAVESERIVDWLVEMRRLPTELTLDALHRSGELNRQHSTRLADALVRFYRSLAPLEVSPEEYRERYTQHVRANLHELLGARRRLSRPAVQRAHSFQLQLLRLCPALFDARVRSGLIVDGHGDLRPEHICLSEPIAIFDCIEFNAELRRIDVADELAFLAEECDCLGARWVGPALLEAYQAAGGHEVPAILFDFYKSYRACVRSKVAALRADQLDSHAQQPADEEARRHLALADEYARPWNRPLVLLVGGLSGTGKTTLASALADALGAEMLRTDIIRKEIFGAGPHITGSDSGIYRPEARKRVYAEMIARLKSLHAEQLSVVLDGTFSTHEMLRSAQAVIKQPQTIFLAIQCVCRKELAMERIGVRLAEGQDASDARAEIHEMQHMQWETWPADVPQIQVDTEQPIDAQVEGVLQTLAARYGLA